MECTSAGRGTRRRGAGPVWVAAVFLGLAGALGGCSVEEYPCEPEGEAVASSPQVGVIALDEEAVYWTALPVPEESRAPEIWRKPKSGGEPARLYQGVGELSFPFPRLSVDATHVYWLEPCSRPYEVPCAEVRRIPKSGGEAQTLVRDRVYTFVVDGDTLYFTTSNERLLEGNPSEPDPDGAVWAMPKDASGPPVALASNLARLRQMAVDGSHVYFIAARGVPPGVEEGGEAWISRVPKTGGDVEVAALATIRPDDFVLTARGVVYLSYRTLYRVEPGTIKPVMLNRTIGDDMEGLAVIGDTLYYGDSGHYEGTFPDPDVTRYSCGSIRSLPLSGGEGEPFSREQIHPRALATDGEMLYWASGEPGHGAVTILRSRP